MIDVKGIFKIEGRNEEIFKKHLNDAMKHGLISSEEEALNNLAEIATGKEGININKQVGLDNEFGVEILLDAWRDDIGRIMNNPVFNIIFKPIQISDRNKSIPGPNGTNKIIPGINIVGLLKIKNADGTFYRWSDYDTDVMIVSIKAENTNKRKVQNIVMDKIYSGEACSKGPENKFPFFEVDDRCCNAQEVSHSFPTVKEVIDKIWGEPIPINEIENHISVNGFDLKFVRGRVSGIQNPKAGKTHVNFNLGDSSVTIDDINSNKFGAYLKVGTSIDVLSSQSFGNNSYLYIISYIQKDEPRDGYEVTGHGVTAWYPKLIYPVIRQNQDEFKGANVKGSDAGDVINQLKGMGKSEIPKTPNFPSAEPQPTTSTQEPKPELNEPKPEVSSGKRGKKGKTLPIPNEPRAIDKEKRLQECPDFGSQDDDPGCDDCKVNSPELYEDCRRQTEINQIQE